MAAHAHPQNMALESRQSVVRAHGADRDTLKSSLPQLFNTRNTTIPKSMPNLVSYAITGNVCTLLAQRVDVIREIRQPDIFWVFG